MKKYLISGLWLLLAGCSGATVIRTGNYAYQISATADNQQTAYEKAIKGAQRQCPQGFYIVRTLNDFHGTTAMDFDYRVSDSDYETTLHIRCQIPRPGGNF